MDYREGTEGVIGREYSDHVPPGSPASVLLLHLASSNRIHNVNLRDAPRSVAKFALQRIRNIKDRAFLKAASLSTKRTLVSCDYADFPIAKRTEIRRKFDVSVLLPAECTWG